MSNIQIIKIVKKKKAENFKGFIKSLFRQSNPWKSLANVLMTKE